MNWSSFWSTFYRPRINGMAGPQRSEETGTGEPQEAGKIYSIQSSQRIYMYSCSIHSVEAKGDQVLALDTFLACMISLLRMLRVLL